MIENANTVEIMEVSGISGHELTRAVTIVLRFFVTLQIVCSIQPSTRPSVLATRTPIRDKFLLTFAVLARTFANPSRMSSRNLLRNFSTPLAHDPRPAKHAIRTTGPEKPASAKIKTAYGAVAIISLMYILLSSLLRVTASHRIDSVTP